MSHKNQNERGWVGQVTVKLDETDECETIK